jgi:hypothetical protein
VSLVADPTAGTGTVTATGIETATSCWHVGPGVIPFGFVSAACPSRAAPATFHHFV